MYYRRRGSFHWGQLLVWVEPVVSALVGVVLFFPLQRPDLADIAWILGVLFSFNSLALTQRLQDEFERVNKLSETMDLMRVADVQSIGRIYLLYMEIREAEFRILKDEIIQRCLVELGRLAHDKAFLAAGSEYYIWLRDMMRSTNSADHIRAVSMMLESDWTDVPAERAYLEENIAAAKRGVPVERIFVLEGSPGSTDIFSIEVVRQHAMHLKDGMRAYIVWQKELASRDPKLLEELGEGFVLFGDRTALIDVTIPPNKASGNITMNPVDIERCRRMYERLILFASPAESVQVNARNRGTLPPSSD